MNFFDFHQIIHRLTLKMFLHEFLADDSIIVVTGSGHVTFDSYQNSMPKVFSEIKARNIRKLLLDNSRLQGWETGNAEALSPAIWLEARSHLDRVAIISNGVIHQKMDQFREFMQSFGKEAKLFGVDQKDEALNWLKRPLSG